MSSIPKQESEFNKYGISIYDRRKDSITWNFMYEDPDTKSALYDDWQSEYDFLSFKTTNFNKL